MIPVEIAVDTLAGIAAAAEGGAARVELCAALSEGGLTPPPGLMAAAGQAGLPVFAMIRPRSGLFHWSEPEIAAMRQDVRAARAAGLQGVVIGAQTAGGELDAAVLAMLIAAARPLGVTLHRVIDVVPEPARALEAAIGLGIDRVLTSGGAATAWEGRAALAGLVQQAAGRISVMAGSGVTAEGARALVAATGVDEVHASCRGAAEAAAPLGFDPPGGRRGTDPRRVAALVAALEERPNLDAMLSN